MESGPNRKEFRFDHGRTDGRTDRQKSAGVELRFAAKKRVSNIIDIKLHFVYTFLLNLQLDQWLNIYLHRYYKNIGPLKAFNLWWSYFVLENLGE